MGGRSSNEYRLWLSRPQSAEDAKSRNSRPGTRFWAMNRKTEGVSPLISMSTATRGSILNCVIDLASLWGAAGDSKLRPGLAPDTSISFQRLSNSYRCAPDELPKEVWLRTV